MKKKNFGIIFLLLLFGCYENSEPTSNNHEGSEEETVEDNLIPLESSTNLDLIAPIEGYNYLYSKGENYVIKDYLPILPTDPEAEESYIGADGSLKLLPGSIARIIRKTRWLKQPAYLIEFKIESTNVKDTLLAGITARRVLASDVEEISVRPATREESNEFHGFNFP